MANRPPFLCELEKDKFIGGQFGFVDTFNWAVRAIDNLEGGTNCEVKWIDDDHPVINVTLPNDYGSEGGGGSGGGGIDEAVYDVAAATQDGHNGISVTYADARSPTFIQFPSLSVDAVEDITRTAGSGDRGDELSVKYTDGTDSTVPLYTSLSGTNNTSDKDTEFKFTSASDSNVVVTISDKQI